MGSHHSNPAHVLRAPCQQQACTHSEGTSPCTAGQAGTATRIPPVHSSRPPSPPAHLLAPCPCAQHPATHVQAEQVLLQFRQSQRPITACQFILEHSGMVDARCHAAMTLKYAAVREWASMAPGERVHLRSYILQV